MERKERMERYGESEGMGRDGGREEGEGWRKREIGGEMEGEIVEKERERDGEREF
jgi:hypothetical protein